MKTYKTIVLLFYAVIVLTLTFSIGFCQGNYKGKVEIKNRAKKTEKEFYTNQDIEILVFGVIQE
mgnify:CR=1 FL=1|jgi:hypothetical protein